MTDDFGKKPDEHKGKVTRLSKSEFQLVQPEGLGITGRIKKAMMDHNLNLTQRIGKAVGRYVQDKESNWHGGRNLLVSIGILVVLVALLLYAAVRARPVTINIIPYKGAESSPLPIKLSVGPIESSQVVTVPDHMRPISIFRSDVYGHGKKLSNEEYEIYEQNKGEPEKVKNFIKTGVLYNLVVKKDGYKEVRQDISADQAEVKIHVKLDPIAKNKGLLRVRIEDPLREEEIYPDDIVLAESGMSIKNEPVAPGKYSVKILKAGYAEKNTEIEVAEDGKVKDSVKMDYKRRPVRFLLGEELRRYPDVFPGADLKTHELVFTRDGNKIEMQQGTLEPGKYDLLVKRDGYREYKSPSLVTIQAGEDVQNESILLEPLQREIVIQPNYNQTPPNPNEYKAYLRNMQGTVIPISTGLKIVPQKYWLTVSKDGYKDFHTTVTVTPSSQPYFVRAEMLLMTKLLILQVTTDYDEEPATIPDHLAVDMEIAKKGYLPVPWGKHKQSLTPTRLEIEVPAFLETIPVQVVAEVVSDIDNQQMDLATLNKLTIQHVRAGKIIGQSVDLKPSNQKKIEVKPARYRLEIEKVGYENIHKEIVVGPRDPNDPPYPIKEKLQAVKRPLIIKLDSDYDPANFALKADLMLLNNEPIESGTKLKPGSYTLTIRKKGYNEVEEKIKIDPGTEDFVFKKTLEAKDRLLVYDVRGEDGKKVDPDKVTLNETEYKENSKIAPKKAYAIKIEKKGYEVKSINIPIEPSDEPFKLKESLSTLTREFQLLLTATFPVDQELKPDQCTLENPSTGIVVYRPGVTIKPGKYNMVIKRNAYETINREIEVQPDVVPFQLRERMSPKARPVDLQVLYDVKSEKPITPLTTIKSADDTVQKNINVAQEKMQLIPNKYYVEIAAEGYQHFKIEVIVEPGEMLFPLHYTLKAEPRGLVVSTTADYPAGLPLKPTRLLLDGKEITVDGAKSFIKVNPGEHTLTIDAEGYGSISEKVVVPAGVNDYEVKKEMTALPRAVTYKVVDAENENLVLNPDFLTLDKVSVTQNKPFKPGRYQLHCEVKGYEARMEECHISPAKEPYAIELKMAPASRVVTYEITGLYGEKLEPKEITLNGTEVDGAKKFRRGSYDLVVYVPGFNRLQDKIDISIGSDVYPIRRQLTPKNRKLVFQITGSFQKNVKLQPNQVTFDKQVIVDGQEVAPRARSYEVIVQKDGYIQGTQSVTVDPSEDPYTLSMILKAMPRSLRLQVDSDYQPSVFFEPESISANGKKHRQGERVEPGMYKIEVEKPGYQALTFEELVEPGVDEKLVKKTMLTKPRQVNVVITSDFDGEKMAPSTLVLGDRKPEEGPYKPGAYELNVSQKGYDSLREKIDITPAEEAFEIARKLFPQKRKVYFEEVYDVQPGPELGPFKLSMRSSDGVPIRIQKGDELRPAEYVVSADKEGYENFHKTVAIFPGEGPFTMNVEMVAKMVNILHNITYDIRPTTEEAPKVTFIDIKTGIGRHIPSGKFIKPGAYLLEVTHPGYAYATPRKQIWVPPGEKPHHVREMLQAQPRPISFQITHEGVIRDAHEIFIDGELVKPEKTFNPGKKYNLLVKFKEYKTVQKEITLPPGQGPYVADVDLIALKKYEFTINRRFADDTGSKIFDNIRYRLEIFVDGKDVEPDRKSVV